MKDQASHEIDVSIIIPIGPHDESYRSLLEELSGLPFRAQIICVATEPRPVDATPWAQLEWIVSPPGRARQLNAGATASRGRWLWFLHADSHLSPSAAQALWSSLRVAPRALHYFNLDFADGPSLMRLNAWGVWWRSHLLGMPFGDQGLCLERSRFDSLGGYSQSAPYGEDHLLVWAARRRGVSLKCTGTTLLTSARKYRDRGWFRTTCNHLWGTTRQASPQFWLWLRGR